MQALHVLRHLLWYTLARPASFEDWPAVLLNGQVLCYTAVLLVLAAYPRNSWPWAMWRR